MIETLQTAMQERTFNDWLSRGHQSRFDCKIVVSDFDGTLTPKHRIDSDNFRFVASNFSAALGDVLAQPNFASGIVSARSFGEVRRIIEEALIPSRAIPGFSSSEHGAVIFCQKLSPEQESLLARNHFDILPSESIGNSNYTVIRLAKKSADFIKENIVLPIMSTQDSSHWASSFTHVANREQLFQLQELSRHLTPEDTMAAVERFGSGYVKINGCDNADAIVDGLIKSAKDQGVYALHSPPHPDDPDRIQTVDFSPGTDKADALSEISRAVAILTGRQEYEIPFAYFGDGENDRAAFNYISGRPGNNQSFLVDSVDGSNRYLKDELVNSAVFLEDFYHIHGVQEGLRRFL